MADQQVLGNPVDRPAEAASVARDVHRQDGRNKCVQRGQAEQHHLDRRVLVVRTTAPVATASIPSPGIMYGTTDVSPSLAVSPPPTTSIVAQPEPTS